MSSFLECFEERYARPSKEVCVETAKGDRFFFSVVDDVKALTEAAKLFAKDAKTDLLTPQVWKEWMPSDRKTVVAAFMLFKTCIRFEVLSKLIIDDNGEEVERKYEDAPIPTQLEWFQVSKKNSVVFEEIKSGWEIAQYGADQAYEVEVYTKAGEDSGATNGTIQSALSPETSTDSTTTS